MKHILYWEKVHMTITISAVFHLSFMYTKLNMSLLHYMSILQVKKSINMYEINFLLYNSKNYIIL